MEIGEEERERNEKWSKNSLSDCIELCCEVANQSSLIRSRMKLGKSEVVGTFQMWGSTCVFASNTLSSS